MTKSTKSFDQVRRVIRRELHQQRCQDDDHSEQRLFQDAFNLDRSLKDQGFKLPYLTEWSRFFNEKRHAERTQNTLRKALDRWQIDFISEDIPKLKK